MMKMKYKFQCSIDNILIASSILYITLPVIFFAIGYLKTLYAIPITIFMVFFIYKNYILLTRHSFELINKKNFYFWIVTAFAIFLWVHLSGIGSMSYQTGDFWARNPMYRDMINMKWPIVFDLSKQSELVKRIAGTDEVAYSYYFGFWLTPAVICKLFSFLSINTKLFIVFQRVVIEIYALIGVYLVVYNIVRILNKVSYIIPLVFVFFSGLDYIGNLIVNLKFPIMSHIEWWSTYYQYSSNTTLLYWVFNQAIPVWLITSLFLQIEKSGKIGIMSLSFPFCPWATIGFIPIALVDVFDEKIDFKLIKKVLNVENILMSIVMIMTFGLLYICGTGDSGQNGFIFVLYKNDAIKVLLRYILFILLEVLVFYFVFDNNIKKSKYYYVVLLELIIFPLFRVRQYSFNIRGSIPALFILMIFCIKMLLICKFKYRKYALMIILCIGALTPFNELNRNIYNTIFGGDAMINETVYSFDDIRTDNEIIITEIKNIYFRYDYKDSFFFKYLAKSKSEKEGD